MPLKNKIATEKSSESETSNGEEASNGEEEKMSEESESEVSATEESGESSTESGESSTESGESSTEKSATDDSNESSDGDNSEGKESEDSENEDSTIDKEEEEEEEDEEEEDEEKDEEEDEEEEDEEEEDEEETEEEEEEEIKNSESDEDENESEESENESEEESKKTKRKNIKKEKIQKGKKGHIKLWILYLPHLTTILLQNETSAIKGKIGIGWCDEAPPKSIPSKYKETTMNWESFGEILDEKIKLNSNAPSELYIQYGLRNDPRLNFGAKSLNKGFHFYALDNNKLFGTKLLAPLATAKMTPRNETEEKKGLLHKNLFICAWTPNHSQFKVIA